MTAIVVNIAVIRIRFHCEMKKKDVLPALDLTIHEMVWPSKAMEIANRRNARNLVDTQGAAFK